MKIKGFITNLGKYNEGHLVGEWITFPIDQDELDAVLKRIGINDEYEEYFFTDWEFDVETGFCEYMDVDDVNELAEQLEEWEEDLLRAAVEYRGDLETVLETTPEDWCFYPNVECDYDLGYMYAVDCECADFKNNPILERYFDFEAYGQDIRLETEGAHTAYGWIEYIGR